MPFMTLGISILFKKPAKQTPPLFSFFQPLSIEVWFYMGTAYLGVSLYLYFLARLSPYEWVKPPKSAHAGKNIVTNTFTLHNSFYSMMGFLMRRGCHFLPRLVWSWIFDEMLLLRANTCIWSDESEFVTDQYKMSLICNVPLVNNSTNFVCFNKKHNRYDIFNGFKKLKRLGQ